MTSNVDPTEISKFDRLARSWWDPAGDFKPLHDLNPLRVSYIETRLQLAGTRIADIGCGGGILAESLARAGAMVTGTDMAEKPLQVARLHATESGVDVDYRQTTVEALADSESASFDAVTCFEMLEHVPDPGSVIAGCAKLLKPGGDLFLSTINRNPKSYLLAILGAEYVLGLLPRGTHDYAKFIRPSELAEALRTSQLILTDVTGMTYNPLTRNFSLGRDVDVNYLVHAHKPVEQNL